VSNVEVFASVTVAIGHSRVTRCSSQDDRVAECRHALIRVTHLDANEL